MTRINHTKQWIEERNLNLLERLIHHSKIRKLIKSQNNQMQNGFRGKNEGGFVII